MKARVERAELADAFGWVHGAVGQTVHLAALSGCLFVAEEGKLTLRASDIETSATVSIPATIDEPGSVLVPRRMAATVGRMAGEGVDIQAADGEVTLRSGRTNAAARTLDVEDFPNLPYLDEGGVTLPAEIIERIAKHVRPFVSTRADHGPVQGVCVAGGDGKLTFHATDSYRMQRLTVEADAQIPPTSLPPSLFTSGFGACELIVGENHAQLDDGERVITTSLMGGQPPNFEAFWASGAGGPEVTVDRKALLDALARVASVTGKKNNPVCRLDIGEGGIEMVATADGESIEDGVEAFATDTWTTHVNPSFLSSLVTTHQADAVTIGQPTPNKPMTLTSDDPAVTSLTMPVSPGKGR